MADGEQSVQKMNMRELRRREEISVGSLYDVVLSSPENQGFQEAEASEFQSWATA